MRYDTAMCGIAGSVSMEGADRSAVASMIGAMIHRGPDEGGIWAEGDCALGHRRLRIIDLSESGSQPMRETIHGVTLVFNGEIFNFRELRESLRSLGHAFCGSSDTEVLLRGYIEWGTSVVTRLRGMFAFAIWDARAKSLFLARDRYGKKPLFYHFRSGVLHFASELDALISGLPERPGISASGFADYMRFGYVPGEATVLEKVYRLPPGGTLVWKNGTLTPSRFAGELSHASNDGPRTEFSAAELKSLLRSAVSERLVSDVPLGCFLSGGTDSALVVALAREIHGPGLKTFTVSFPGTVRDEGAAARRIAERLGTAHCQIDILPSDMEQEYAATLARCPEPLGDDSFIPTYFISRATREHVTVALSGDGGDELFGGYPKYRQIRLGEWLHPAARAIPRMLRAHLPDRYAKALDVLRLSDEGLRALWLSSLWKDDELPAILTDPASATAGRAFFLAEWRSHSAASLQERFSLTDLTTYLEGSILTKVDRAGMAASLEVRSPLLDERILDMTLSTGVRSTRFGCRKQALKILLADYLPTDFFTGPKRGFGLPIDEWFRGRLRGVLEEYTSADRLRREGLVNPAEAARLRALHLSGHRNYGRKLHALVAWGIWRERSGL